MNIFSFGPAVGLFGLLCPLLGLGFFVLVIVLIVKAIARSGSGGGGTLVESSVSMDTSSGEDGFWIEGEGLAPGTLLDYYYWVGGLRRAERVPFQPGPDGRQFIYTGSRPDRVSVAPVQQRSVDDSPLLLGAALGSGTSWESSDDSSSFPPPSSSSFPSAY